MKATALYRIASVLLVMIVVANTVWLMYFSRVTAAMSPVRFPFGHRPLSYSQVVLGFNVFCSLCVLFAAFLAWHLGSLARTAPRAIGALGWLLLAYLVAGTFVSLYYFSGFAFLLSAAIALCTARATSLAAHAQAAPSLAN